MFLGPNPRRLGETEDTYAIGYSAVIVKLPGSEAKARDLPAKASSFDGIPGPELIYKDECLELCAKRT